jgi:hypothetical protein
VALIRTAVRLKATLTGQPRPLEHALEDPDRRRIDERDGWRLVGDAGDYRGTETLAGSYPRSASAACSPARFSAANAGLVFS